MNLKQLKKDKEKLEIEINELINKSNKIQFQIDELEYGLKIGDKINYEGKNYIVSGYSSFWIKGKLVKKDGTISERCINLYNTKRKD